MVTPLRRLDGISYWVIEDPDGIYDFIPTEVGKEWEEDIKSMTRDPASGLWLETLPKRTWQLETIQLETIRLDEALMIYVDNRSGYNFAERLAKRRQELRKGLELWRRVIWPIVVREKDMEVLDGYCRYTALKEIGVSKLYAYVERL